MLASMEEAVVPAQRLRGTVDGLFVSDGEDFRTLAVDALDLGFEGIAGDVHGGFTRRSTGREPWYPRATEIRNERQLSIVDPDELAEIAAMMEVERVAPEWVGANLTLSDIPRLSMLPPRTLLFFAGGVTLKIDGQNAPCRKAGRAIAEHVPGREGLDLLFAKVAKRHRGLVAWVEKPGRIAAGEAVDVRLPEQWLYVT